jgi:hypothetical protein
MAFSFSMRLASKLSGGADTAAFSVMVKAQKGSVTGERWILAGRFGVSIPGNH